MCAMIWTVLPKCTLCTGHYLTMKCTWLSITNKMSRNHISLLYHVDSLFDQTTKSRDMQNSPILLLIEMWQCSILSLLVHNAFCFGYYLYMHSTYLAVWLVFCSERYYWCIIIMQFLFATSGGDWAIEWLTNWCSVLCRYVFSDYH